MIDPLAVVIAHLEGESAITDIVGAQIAARHKFALPQAGRSWAVSAGVGALVVRYAPGAEVHLAVSVQTVRLEARCYGVSEDEAGALWRALAAVSRETNRASVATSDGTGLLYWLLADGSPVFELDPDLRVPAIVQSLRAQVHEDSLT